MGRTRQHLATCSYGHVNGLLTRPHVDFFSPRSQVPWFGIRSGKNDAGGLAVKPEMKEHVNYEHVQRNRLLSVAFPPFIACSLSLSLYPLSLSRTF